jgi:hypothetical protein
MSDHNLTEYLASIGAPELEKVKHREEMIHQQMQQLAQSDDPPSVQKEIKLPPDFQARYKIKNLFAQFAEGFSDQARNSGVELQWIGVGTWESQVDIVPDKHLEAWMLTQENLKADSPDAMGKIEKVEGTEKMKELIHKVPLEAFEGIANVTKQAKRYWKHTPRKKPSHKLENADDIILFPQEDEMTQVEKMLVMWNTMQEENSEFEESETDHDNNLKTLLLEYRKQFIETAEFIKAKNEPIPLSLQEAISHIDNQIGYHWVRKS